MDTEDVNIEPYNPEWPKKFENEAQILHEVLDGNQIISIKHVGSTAIPGLSAKPVIDILIGVKSLPDIKEFIPILEKLEYSYWDKNPQKDGYFFVKGLPPNGPRTFHIHIVEMGSKQWEKLLFRDYLRNHPNEAKSYEKLKFELAEKYKTDREAYSNAKGEYIESIIEKAKQERT